jgi:hypothetical protein
MGARKRLPDDAIIGAIQKWRGNVTAAAEALGLAPINLRKRLVSLGVDLTLLRRLKDTGIHGTHRNVLVPMDTNTTYGPLRNKNVGNIFRPRVGGATFAPVSTEAMMGRPKTPAPIRLNPEQVERLRDAKFELQYHLRAEVNESAILQQFFEDGFAEWLKARLREPQRAEEKQQQ